MAGSHIPEKGWQVRGRSMWSRWLSATLRRPLDSLYPSSASGEQDKEVPACCLLSLEVLPPQLCVKHGAGCPLSQVECFETGSGEFLQTKGKATEPCERLQNSTKEPESISCRWSSKIPNFCLGSRKHLKGKERKSLCVSMQCKEVGFSFTTQLSGLYFYGGKTLTQSEHCW